MDITVLFRGCVEIARRSNKDVDKILEGNESSTKNGLLSGKPNSSVSKSKLFPGKKSEYYSQARDLLTTLTGLKKYLNETRSPYLNIGGSKTEIIPTTQFSKNPIPSSKSSTPTLVEMTNAERDLVDQDVQQIIQNCQKRIFEFQKVIEITGAEEKQPQLFTHLDSICTSLGVYMKEICAFYSEMRAIRVKRTVDFQAMSKLSSSGAGSNGKGNKYSKNPSFESLTESNDKKFPKSERFEAKPKVSKVDVEYQHQMSSAAAAYFEDDEELSPEELQMLEEENVQLYNELNSLSDEVDQIQRSVVQIAQLQSIFTEKVMQDEKKIENISTLIVGATENTKDGNEQIRQAIQQSADFRAWVLFFIIVMSLSLLFLDWYND